MLRKNLLQNLLLSFTQIIYPLIIFGYTAKIIGPEYLGKISFIDNLVRQLIVFCSLGLNIYGLKIISENKDNIEKRLKRYSELFTIQATLTVITLILLNVSFSHLNFMENYREFGVLCSIMLIGNALTNDWYFQAIDKYNFLVIRSNIIRIASLILLFSVIKEKDDYWYLFLIISCTSFINGCVNFYWLIKNTDGLFNLPKLGVLRSHLKPLFYTFLATFSVSFYLQMDSVLLGILADESSLGIYTIISKISKVPTYLIASAGVVMTSKIASHKITTSSQNSNKNYNQSLELMGAIIIPLFIYVVVLAKPLILLLGGYEFLEGEFALQILAFSILFVGLSNVFGIQILMTRSRENQFAIATFSGMATNIILNFILIPKFKTVGAVISIVVTEFVVLIIVYFFSCKLTRVKISLIEKYNYALMLLLITPSLIMVRYLIQNIYLQVLIGILVTIILFFLISLRNKNSIVISLLKNEI